MLVMCITPYVRALFFTILSLSYVGHVHNPSREGTFLSTLTLCRSRAGGSEPKKKLRF
jgi:hypothetical protein